MTRPPTGVSTGRTGTTPAATPTATTTSGGTVQAPARASDRALDETPAPKYLNATQVQGILANVSRQGWNAEDHAVPELKAVGGISGAEMVNTGRWILNINDGPGGHNQQVYLRATGNLNNPTATVWVVEGGPEELPKVDPNARKYIERNDGSVYVVDPGNNVTRIFAPGGVKEPTVSEQIANDFAQHRLNELRKNLADGKGYRTDQQIADEAAQSRQTGVSEATLRLARDKFEEENRQWTADFERTGRVTTSQINRAASAAALDDQQVAEMIALGPAKLKQLEASGVLSTAQADQIRAAMVREDKLAGAQVPEIEQRTKLLGAQTTAAESEDLLNQEQLRQLVLMGPDNLEKLKKANLLTDVQIEQARAEIAKANRPTVVQPGEGPTIVTQDAQGNLTETPRMGYMPKTPAEVQARVGQMQAMAKAKSEELATRVQNKQLTEQQADAEFERWYGQNVAPQLQALDAAQRTAIAEEQRKQNIDTRANYELASGIGQNAVTNWQNNSRYRVGPGWGQAMSGLSADIGAGRMPGAIDFGGAFSYQEPDMAQMAEQATARALAHISPMAAQIAGTGPPAMSQLSPMDIQAALARQNYQRQAVAQAGPPAAAPPTTAAPAAVQQQVMPAGPPIQNYGGVGPYANGGMPAPGTTYYAPGYDPRTGQYIPPPYQPGA